MERKTVHKKTNFSDIIFDANVKIATAFGLAIIALLLVYIAFHLK
ncbi:MAG TPA: hypothetical protein VE090_03445 [Methylomirabilota bacterium]|nr:hypothetical protein [Methylomirabilota bacterium]